MEFILIKSLDCVFIIVSKNSISNSLWLNYDFILSLLIIIVKRNINRNIFVAIKSILHYVKKIFEPKITEINLTYGFKFYPAYIKITKTLNQAVLLSYFVKADETYNHKEFSVSNESLKEKLNLKTGAISHSKKALMELGFINVRRSRQSKCNYTINMDKINKALEERK